MNSKIS